MNTNELGNQDDEIWHVGADAHARLAALGLTEADLQAPLDIARADSLLCTELDSPGAPGYMFWSRTNRYFRERMIPKGWTWTNRDTILRTIDPAKNFIVTAMSGDGGVGVPQGRVSTKNPKGAAVAALVRYNYSVFGGPKNQHPLPTLEDKKPKFEPGTLPAWFLLYKWTPTQIVAELAMPSDMRGKFVNQWREHIIIGPVEFPGGQVILDVDPYNNDLGDGGIDVPVERVS